jgi:hypothetical protein
MDFFLRVSFPVTIRLARSPTGSASVEASCKFCSCGASSESSIGIRNRLFMGATRDSVQACANNRRLTLSFVVCERLCCARSRALLHPTCNGAV